MWRAWGRKTAILQDAHVLLKHMKQTWGPLRFHRENCACLCGLGQVEFCSFSFNLPEFLFQQTRACLGTGTQLFPWSSPSCIPVLNPQGVFRSLHVRNDLCGGPWQICLIEVSEVLTQKIPLRWRIRTLLATAFRKSRCHDGQVTDGAKITIRSHLIVP